MKKLLFIFLFSVYGLNAQFPIEINFNVHNDVKPDNEYNLSFGVNSLAGDTVDISLGEESLPPYPFSIFYCALEYTDSTKFLHDSTKYYDEIRTNKDLRGIPNDSNKFYKKYKLHIVWYNSKKVTINWGTSPQNKNIDSIFLKDALNGILINKNMKTQNSVELSDVNSISDLYFHVYYSKSTVSVKDNNDSYSDLIYPNPVENSLHFQKSNMNYFKIYDVYGNLILQNSFYKEIIDVSSLQKGFYLLYLNNAEGEIKYYKFIKN